MMTEEESANRMSYLGELGRAMTMLAQDERTIFVGQAVKFGGQRAHATFADVPRDRCIEMPVIEDFQVGFCAGLALEGYIPVSFFPRWDFLLLAANQLVNHLDKMPDMGWTPKVIIRTAVGASAPLNPGPQHTQNHSAAFASMLRNIPVIEVRHEHEIEPAYQSALSAPASCIVVEFMERY